MRSFVRTAAVFMACAGMLLPAATFGAAPNNAKTVRDVSLQAGGAISGRVVDAQGAAVAKAPLVVRKNGLEVTRTLTDAQGQFTATGLQGGIYQFATIGAAGTVRAWTARTAPPIAQKSLQLTQSCVVRGQSCTTSGCSDGCCGGCCDGCSGGCRGGCSLGGWAGGLGSPLVIGAVLAAAIALPIALHDDDDATP